MNRVSGRRFLALLRSHAGGVVAAGVAAAAGALLQLGPPLVVRRLLDEALPRHEGRLLAGLVATLAGLALAAGLASLSEAFLAERVGQAVLGKLRQDLFARLQRQDLAFYTGERPGALASAVLTDVEEVHGALRTALTEGWPALCGVAATLAVLVALAPGLGLLAALLVPATLLGVRWLRRPLNANVALAQGARAQLSAFLNQALGINGCLARGAFGGQAVEAAELSALGAALAARDTTRTLAQRQLTVGLATLGALAAAAGYALGGQLVFAGQASAGGVVASVALLGQLLGSLLGLARTYVATMVGLGCLERLEALADRPPTVADRMGARRHPASSGSLAFEEVTFGYRPEVALFAGVSFVLEPGGWLGLMGPSGAGKTTLAYLAPRFLDPRAGRVLLDGHDLRDLALEDVQAHVGLIPQEPWLFHASLADNLRYARPGATDAELLEACEAAELGDLVAGLPMGLATVVGERGFRFSGGERQRVAIARMILRAPRILVLDEATSALDPDTERRVLANLRTALPRTSVLAIAHRLGSLEPADEIRVLEAGGLVERRSPVLYPAARRA